MPARAPYRSQVRAERTAQTRERILGAVGDLLREGVFHECTVEEVADRAGVSRATLYQHFRSRLELVDGVCDFLALNPALLQLRGTVELDDPETALADTMELATRFWASEDKMLEQLYDVAAVDTAARDFVTRQYNDRRSEMERLARNLRRSGRLRTGVSERKALTHLLWLSSYGTHRELQSAGLGEREIVKHLQEAARRLLFDD